MAPKNLILKKSITPATEGNEEEIKGSKGGEKVIKYKGKAVSVAPGQSSLQMPNDMLTERQAAAYINMSMQWFQRDRWYSNKEGIPPTIPYYKSGTGAVRYRRSDLDAHLDTSRVG